MLQRSFTTHSHQIDTGNVASSFMNCLFFMRCVSSVYIRLMTSWKLLQESLNNLLDRHFTQNSFIRSTSGEKFNAVVERDFYLNSSILSLWKMTFVSLKLNKIATKTKHLKVITIKCNEMWEFLLPIKHQLAS